MGNGNSTVTNTQIINVIGDANTAIAETRDAFGNPMKPTAQPDLSGSPDAAAKNMQSVQDSMHQLALARFWTDYSYLWATDGTTPPSAKQGREVIPIDRYAHIIGDDLGEVKTYINSVVATFRVNAATSDILTKSITDQIMSSLKKPLGGVESDHFSSSAPYPADATLTIQLDIDVVYLNIQGESGVEHFVQVLGQQYLTETF